MTQIQVEIPVPTFKFIDESEDVFPSLWRGGVSEFIATGLFLFIGCGVVVASQAQLGTSTIGVPNMTLIGLAHGFAIMVLIYSIGEVSGGHINPIVTWALFISGKISFIRALVYVISQLVGGVIGVGLLQSFLPVQMHFSLGCLTLNSSLSPAQGFAAELIYSFILVFVVFAVAIDPFAGKMAPLSGTGYGPGKFAPFAIGMTVLILVLLGVPITGAGMNPARALGPAVFAPTSSICWKHHWIYWIGPLIGSTLAAVVAYGVFLNSPKAIMSLSTTSKVTTEPPKFPQEHTPQPYTDL